MSGCGGTAAGASSALALWRNSDKASARASGAHSRGRRRVRADTRDARDASLAQACADCAGKETRRKGRGGAPGVGERGVGRTLGGRAGGVRRRSDGVALVEGGCYAVLGVDTHWEGGIAGAGGETFGVVAWHVPVTSNADLKARA